MGLLYDYRVLLTLGFVKGRVDRENLTPIPSQNRT
jgi:hypothetical protein